MKELENIIDQMQEIINILDPEILHKIYKNVDSINKSIKKMIDGSTGVLTLDNDITKHDYYVNNGYAKVQLQKILPSGCNIQITPDVEIGTIIIVKHY